MSLCLLSDHRPELTLTPPPPQSTIPDPWCLCQGVTLLCEIQDLSPGRAYVWAELALLGKCGVQGADVGPLLRTLHRSPHWL